MIHPGQRTPISLESISVGDSPVRITFPEGSTQNRGDGSAISVSGVTNRDGGAAIVNGSWIAETRDSEGASQAFYLYERPNVPMVCHC